MLKTYDIETFLAETASAVSTLPSWQNVDATRRPGHVRALAWRCAS